MGSACENHHRQKNMRTPGQLYVALPHFSAFCRQEHCDLKTKNCRRQETIALYSFIIIMILHPASWESSSQSAEHVCQGKFNEGRDSKIAESLFRWKAGTGMEWCPEGISNIPLFKLPQLQAKFDFTEQELLNAKDKENMIAVELGRVESEVRKMEGHPDEAK